jgi:hypothetical protein
MRGASAIPGYGRGLLTIVLLSAAHGEAEVIRDPTISLAASARRLPPAVRRMLAPTRT